MSDHTPAPWVATEPNGPGMGWKVGPAWLGNDPGSARTAADARLIAKAPRLLIEIERLRLALSIASDTVNAFGALSRSQAVADCQGAVQALRAAIDEVAR